MSETPTNDGSRQHHCPKCGRLNPHGVTVCRHCGTALTPAPELPTGADAPRRMALRPRLLVSAIAGLLILCIATYASFQWYRGQAADIIQRPALRRIQAAKEGVDAYRGRHHALPGRLSDVGERFSGPDSWERPLRYQVEGDRYHIVSYGRDGKPGGVGLDYDLSTDDLPKGGEWPKAPLESRATFRQFLADWKHASLRGFSQSGSGGMMALMSGLTGLAAFALAFLVLGRETSPPRRYLSVAVRLIITLFIAFYVGWCIACLHAPVGH